MTTFEGGLGRAVLDASKLGAQRGRTIIVRSDIDANRRVVLVRGEGELHRKSSKCVQCGEPSPEFNGLEDKFRAGVRILYRRLRVLLPNSLMLLQKRAEHGFEIWT